jgi:hypothetical protein
MDSLPQRTSDDDPTDGVLTTTDGQEIERFRSGKKWGTSGVPDLRSPWNRAWSVTDHAEGHAANQMRLLGIRDATLYVNNEPCGGRLGCDRTLPKILPVGSRLTVYGPNGFRKVYEGTGEAIA